MYYNILKVLLVYTILLCAPVEKSERSRKLRGRHLSVVPSVCRYSQTAIIIVLNTVRYNIPFRTNFIYRTTHCIGPDLYYSDRQTNLKPSP